jgi:3-oxoacyl-[acyl-carrier-protein] synthase-3
MEPSDIRILSAGTALPGSPVDNAALSRRFGMEQVWEQWIDVFIGIRSRHLAVDLETGHVGTSLCDLAETAARRALAAGGIDAADIDLMVMSTATPDMLMPATVNMVADRLGINNIPTYQLQTGCSGAVQALNVARTMLASGAARNALVLGGDICAKYFDTTMDIRKLPPEQLVNVVLFGDGAGAVVLSTEPAPGSLAIRHVVNRLTGGGRPPGHMLDWFGLADRGDARPAAAEDYTAIAELVPRMAENVLVDLLDALDWKEGDVDFLLPPQLSVRMTERIVRELGLGPAQEVSCVGRTGNNGNALPFLQFEELFTRIGPGERAIGIAIESSKWIRTGIAVEKV